MAFISFKPSDFFNTKLYTGTGSSLANTGVGFQPDITWLKSRSAATSHYLFDSVRGATKALFPDLTDAEAANAEYLKSFDADGFTVGTNAGINDNTKTYVGWNWKAGTTSSITTNGSTTITPSAYSFSTTSGVSIIKYTGNGTAGAKIAHGLGKTPQCIIVKETNAAGEGWNTYHIGKSASGTAQMGNTMFMLLNTDEAQVDNIYRWNDTTPDSVNFTVGTADGVNTSGDTYIAYVFANIPGFSNFGGTMGTGTTDGPFVYTGFEPGFIIWKRNDGATGWYMYSSEIGYNDARGYLQANSTSAEDTNVGNFGLDILSNGFKIRGTHANINTNGGNYIWLCWAKNPMVGSAGTPGVAV
jgi:hypothetical protein|tara:strand:- start:2645 stop:3715 length:1071 start_codon:yes stop_codon:yes gene_type:complete